MYEYTSEVFSVGLQGFAPVDEERIDELAADGWEPSLMTPVHNGFAAVVLFRRETKGARRAPAKAAATRVRKAPPAPVRATRARAGGDGATARAPRAAAGRTAAGTTRTTKRARA